MSLYRALNDACLEAKLTQNEARVYTALMNQTIGYGKTHDNLTDNRLSALTGLRLDRLRTAVEGVAEKELFECRTSRQYQYRYTIAPKFLEKDPTFFTPHLLKNRAQLSFSETNSEIQTLLPNFSYKHNITLTSFTLTTLTQQHLPEPSLAEKKPIEPIHPLAEKKDVVVKIEKTNTTTSPPDQPAGVVSLPRFIEPAHYPTCRGALKGLSFAQQQRVINALEIKDETEVVHNAVGLLISLATAEREGRLIMPRVKQKQQARANPTPQHASHVSFDSPDHPSNQITEGLEDHVGRLNWLRQQASAQNQSMPEFAATMLMNAYLEDAPIVRRWLAFHAKQAQVSADVLAERLGLPLVLSG